MAKAGWLNANETRAFPFLESRSLSMQRFVDGECCAEDAPVDLPDSCIVDFGCTMQPDANYDDANDYVYLKVVCRIGDTFQFEFASNNPALRRAPLLFTRALGDPEFAASIAEQEAQGYVTPCGDASAWGGYLVTGLLDDLAELLADGDSLLGDERIRVEPSLIFNDARSSSLRSVSVASYSQQRQLPAIDCGDPETITDGFVANGACITDHLRLMAGYNVTMRYDPVNATFTFGAAVGQGLGEPCGELPRHVDQAKPTGSGLYSGGLQCSEVVKGLHGASGPHVKVKGKGGIVIDVSEAASHRLIVRFDPQTMATGCEET